MRWIRNGLLRATCFALSLKWLLEILLQTTHTHLDSDLDSESRQQYFSKLKLKTGKQLPDPLAIKECWNNDISNLPNLSWRDVTEYLIDSPSVFTKESLKAYKSLEAYDYFTCGHVQDCYYHPITNESEFCYIKSEVCSNIFKKH